MAQKRRRRRRRVHLAGLGAPTRKEFQAVADILCQYDASKGMVEAFAAHYKRQNARFSTSRFVDAVQACKRR